MKKQVYQSLKVCGGFLAVSIFFLGLTGSLAEASSTLEELQDKAEVSYHFEEAEGYFDGTKTLDKSADLAKIKDLTEGTIILRAKFTGTPDPTSMYALLGLGNEAQDANKQIVLGSALDPFAARFEFGDKLSSSAMRSKPFSDNKWHTLAYTAGEDYVSVSVDGESGKTGADGFYQDEKWKGFLSRGQELTTFSIGGFTSLNNNKYPYANWVGEIDFVTITSEVVPPGEADQLTGSLVNDFEIILGNTSVATPEIIGSEVGEITFKGEPTEAVTAQLAPGIKDNDLFTIENNVLKTRTVLKPFTSYTVLVSTDAASSEDTYFTIKTLGDTSGTLLEITEKTSITKPISYPALVAPTSTLTDITIKAQFVQKVSGIGSLISFSNQSAGNEHFHLYANGSSIGYELRGLKGSGDLTASSPTIRSNGLNTVAFKADSSDQTFKLFANGKLVNTKKLTVETYRMLKDLSNGVNAVTIGGTPRSGNVYPFNGTLLKLEAQGSPVSDQELLDYTNDTPAEENEELVFPHIFEATGANFFRIPALYTLNDGTVMAAIDARFGGAADSPNNLDTAINFLDPKTNTWGEATMPLHFDDYTDDPGYVSNSASFIDPVIIQDDQDKIYMAVDAFPAGFGYPNAVAGSGMKTVDGEKVLGLTKKGNDVKKWANFDHYVKDGVVYTAENTKTDYTVDAEFNLSKAGEALYVDQKKPNGTLSGKKVKMNVFYADADFKVYGTSYFVMVTSEDGGKTWSKPMNMNYLKREEDRFWGTGPGRGHRVKVGEYANRIIMPTYDSQDGERVSTIYSDDHGKTWKRGQRTTMASTNSPGKASESQLIELPDGTLRLFARGNTGLIGYGDSFDGGESFEPMRQDSGLAYSGNVMISAINYEGLIDGKKALILSAPEGSGRNNGIIRIGLINEPTESHGEYTIDWKYKYAVNKGGFVYSSLTQLPNGKIALLWENDPNTKPAIYTEYTLEELKNGKSSVTSFTVENPTELVSGGLIKGKLQLKSQIVPELSDLTNSQLTISYPESTHEAAALQYESFDKATNTLIFTGQLPVTTKNLKYEISLAKNNQIFTYGGPFTGIASDLISGEVTVEAEPSDIPVSELGLDVGVLTTLKKGKTLPLGVTVSPENATDQQITWVIEKPEIVEVSADGVLKGLKAGMSRVTAVSHNGKEASVVIRVTK